MKKQHSWKSFRKVLTSTAALGIIAVLLSVSGSAQDNSNSLDVNVNISEKTIIDIQPSSFAWGLSGDGLAPGTFAGPTDELNGYGRLQVENLGSVNISQVWFNTTAPTQRPFGTADSDAYDSANFIQLSSNESTPGTYRGKNAFVGRSEYGIDSTSSQDIIYLETNNNWDFGRFRNGSYEYFWALDDESVSDSGTGGTLRIGIDHHNSTQTGSTNLDDACKGGDEAGTGSANCNGYELSSTSGYTYTEVEIGAEDTSTPGPDGGVTYCAVMNTTEVQGQNNPEIEFIKWNANHPGVQAAGSNCKDVTQYMIDGTELAPGAWETMNIRANIPYGVVSGTLPTGQLTVLANSN